MLANEIRIIIEEKIKNADKKPFNAYKAVLKDGTLVDARFTMEVKNLPVLEKGQKKRKCTIYVLPGKSNLSYKKEYPVLWISQIEHITYGKTQTDAEEEEELFGKPKEFDPKDLPF